MFRKWFYYVEGVLFILTFGFVLENISAVFGWVALVSGILFVIILIYEFAYYAIKRQKKKKQTNT